jgi:amino acid adenylation domain-containing protein
VAVLLNQLVDRAALRAPDAAAAWCDGQTLSYQQLARRANGLARVLRTTGVREGDRVGVLVNKGLDVPICFHGTLAAGATLVPIDPRSPEDQVARILSATGATHVVTTPDKRETVARVLPQCPDVTHAIGLDAGDDVKVSCVSWSAVNGEAADRPPAVHIIDMDPAYILHTSGSTGEPKLILHTHSSAMSFVEWAVAEYELTGADRLSNHSFHHTCFATFDYYAAARARAATVILTPAALMMPASLSGLLERERVSVWYSVPTALVQLSLRGDLEARDLAALRWVLFAGETFPAKHLKRLMQQLPAARLSHVYGSTEVNVCMYYHLPRAEALSGPLPIGHACATSSTVVVDADLQAVPAGEVGELLVRGSTVMSGYWGDERRNRDVLVRRPFRGGLDQTFFRTGDRVRALEDGTLAFVARTDRQVKVRGHRVELDEVEAALLALDVVDEAAVFTVPDGEGSLKLRAAVVVGDSANASARDITAALRRLLPMQAIPADIDVLDALPRTPTGKVDGKALRAMLGHEAAVDDQ